MDLMPTRSHEIRLGLDDHVLAASLLVHVVNNQNPHPGLSIAEASA